MKPLGVRYRSASSKRANPNDREFRRWPLNRIILTAVAEALHCRGPHPDSSKQARARQKARDLRQARLLKNNF